jgi:hypothetical protein
MNKKSTFGLLFVLLIISSFAAQAQNTGLTGEWKINREKTVIAENQLLLSKVTLQLKGDSLLTTRTYEDPNGTEYPFEENLTLDGKESKITIYEMPRTSKATRSGTDGSIIIESTTTFNNNGVEDNLKAKEVWKLDTEGKILSVEFTNKMSAGEVAGTSYYNKVK